MGVAFLLRYKVDWLAFSLSILADNTSGRDDKLMECLGYDLADFDEIPGRWFYNSGATFRNYVNVFWNDPSKPIHKNSSRTMTVVFTGQGQLNWLKSGVVAGLMYFNCWWLTVE